MLLAMPASKRIASRMAQIAANDCSGPQQETQGYQQKSTGAQRPANGCKRWELPCQGRGRGFESLRPLQKFSQSCRSIFGACDAAFPAADDIRSFSPNAGARPVATEGRSPGRDHAA